MSTLLHLIGFLQPAGELSLKDYAVTGFFIISSVIFFIFLQLLGTRLFEKIKESGHIGPRLFAITILSIGIVGTFFSCFISNGEASLVLGFASGVALWTALGDIPEQMDWISPLSRKAVAFFIPTLLIWSVGLLLLKSIPEALFGALGYPVWVWGIHLTRARVLSKWGPTSPAAIILILMMATIGGCALALGIVRGTPFSGIISGVIFAVAMWSALEIVWERGMANQPWKGR